MEQEGSADASHDFDHILRVISLAETIQSREGGDLPTIWAAVAFHDIGQERERQDTIPAVQQAIRDHRMTGGAMPHSLEGRILYDADKIDCLGAIGIGRLYCVTGRYNQKIYSELPADIVEPVDPLTVRALRRRPDYSPSLEFQLLFGNLPERMTTRTGKELAGERYAYMEGFFKRLRLEVAGKL
jgi:uncharacterized protein